MYFIPIFLLLIIVFDKTSATQNNDFIDIIHKEISRAVHLTVQQLDNFFADPKIKEETKAYIRFRTGFKYDTKPDISEILKVDFKIRLAKLEKHLGIVLESYKEKISRKEEEEPIKLSEEKSSNISVGIEYKKRVKKWIKHRISIGITGSPKIYGKYDIFNIPLVYKRWEISIFQRFRAERKINNYKLDETTQIYIDRLLTKNKVLRFYIDRYKQSDQPFQTLTYITSIRIMNPIKKLYKKNMATEILAGLYQKRLFGGRISSYTTQYRIRANFWKNWSFFNIHIGTNWEKNRSFKGTPFFQIYFEFYFGRL